MINVVSSHYHKLLFAHQTKFCRTDHKLDPTKNNNLVEQKGLAFRFFLATLGDITISTGKVTSSDKVLRQGEKIKIKIKKGAYYAPFYPMENQFVNEGNLARRTRSSDKPKFIKYFFGYFSFSLVT